MRHAIRQYLSFPKHYSSDQSSNIIQDPAYCPLNNEIVDSRTKMNGIVAPRVAQWQLFFPLNRFLQGLCRIEPGQPHGRNSHVFSGAGINASPSVYFDHFEGPQ